VVREAIGSATIVEAMIIYHMIAPSPTSESQAQAINAKYYKKSSSKKKSSNKPYHKKKG
jgi:hypothetical protein